MDGTIEQKRLRELALRAAHTGRPQFTRFLEPSMFSEVRAAANACGVRCAFSGGYDGAERMMAAFFDGDAPDPSEYPMHTVCIEWNPKFASPAHRDLLGAVMGTGIERDAVGDIAMGIRREKPCAWLFAAEEMADYIAASLESAGRAAVKAHLTDEPPEILPPEGEHLRVTVQNERLDALLAAGQRLSRSEAQRLVAAGLVKLNHVPCLRPDARVSEGDLISARGYGRLRVEAFMGESRRGRLVVALFRYGAPR
ncbi:MAG: RNA-binding protein [Clostridia bacterium]|nr:RNA-binding protein [Clostridia bacterium]